MTRRASSASKFTVDSQPTIRATGVEVLDAKLCVYNQCIRHIHLLITNQ